MPEDIIQLCVVLCDIIDITQRVLEIYIHVNCLNQTMAKKKKIATLGLVKLFKINVQLTLRRQLGNQKYSKYIIYQLFSEIPPHSQHYIHHSP